MTREVKRKINKKEGEDKKVECGGKPSNNVKLFYIKEDGEQNSKYWKRILISVYVVCFLSGRVMKKKNVNVRKRKIMTVFGVCRLFL